MIALVFAMSGVAFATKYVITSTKQIKPSVLKALKGQQGPQGPQGNPGPAGPQGPKGDTGAKGEAGTPGAKGATGPTGPAGATGATGSPGAAGATGSPGAAGAIGATGATGSPWTAGGTLPSGSTETGSWAAIIPASLGALVGVDFAIPLAAALPESKVHIAPNASCPGTAEEPKAASGHLCVYTGKVDGSGGVVGIIPPGSSAGFGAAVGASRSGAALFLEGSANAIMRGTWAVTAP